MKAPRRYKTGGEIPKKAVKIDLNKWSPEMEAQAKKAYESNINSMAQKNTDLYGGKAYHALGSEGTLGENPLTKKQYTDFQEDPQYKYISGTPGQRVFESKATAGYGPNEIADVNFPEGKPIKYVESTNPDGTRRLLQVPTTTYKPNEPVKVALPSTTPPPFVYNVGEGTYAEQEAKWNTANPSFIKEKANGGKITKAPKRFATGGSVSYDEKTGKPIYDPSVYGQQALADERQKQANNQGYIDMTLGAVNSLPGLIGKGGSGKEGGGMSAGASENGSGKGGGMSGDTKMKLASAGIGLGADITQKYWQGRENDLYNTDKEVDVKDARKASGISGAAGGLKKGMEMGTQFGSVIPGVGTVAGAAIGAGAGLIGGGIYGAVKGDKMADSFNYGIRKAGNEKAYADQQDKFNYNLQKQLEERQAGYAKGGYVNGLGTGTSDSIKAKILPESFIVPAKNAAVGEQVLNHVQGLKKGGITKAPSIKKKADLDQEGGEEVKLSKGEFVFTPQQRKEIISELGEDVLEALAPDAEHGEDEMKNGGLTAAKAKIILHDGTIRGKAITDKQRKYFGAISNGYKCGGEVKGYAKGTDPEGVTGDDEKQQLTKTANKLRADIKAGKASNRGLEFDKKGLREIESKLLNYDEKKKLRHTADKIREDINNGKVSSNGLEFDKKGLREIESKLSAIDKTYIPGKINTAPKIGTTVKAKDIYTGPKGEASDTEVPKEDTQTSYAKMGVNAKPILSETLNTEVVTPKGKQGINGLKTGMDIASQLGGLANYIPGYNQYKMGRQFLAESGKRPVGKIDPDFQDAVNKAQTNARFGYTPEEQALLDQRNINALRTGENAARNYSGGSASNALSLTRQAANDYFGRGLQSAIANKNLQMDKQTQANSMVTQKANMNRQLFEDTMNAWQQNQKAGSSLVGAGLKNMIDANRLNRETAFQNKYAQGNNIYTQDYLNSLG